MKNKFKTTARELEKYGKHGIRTLKNMEKMFFNEDEVKRILKQGGNPVIYETFVKSFYPMDLGLTVLNAGQIGKEFYFTKGHVHRAGTEEFYILLEGTGLLILQKDRKIKKLNLSKGRLILIPRGYAHRLINNGKKKLKVLTIYHENSKPDYSVKFRKRFFSG